MVLAVCLARVYLSLGDNLNESGPKHVWICRRVVVHYSAAAASGPMLPFRLSNFTQSSHIGQLTNAVPG